MTELNIDPTIVKAIDEKLGSGPQLRIRRKAWIEQALKQGLRE